MKQGGGKQKGAEFERGVCKTLSLWISDGERDDLLWRSAMSGGRATVQVAKGVKNETQTGDITAIDPLAAPFIKTFMVECKHYKELGLLSGVLKTKGTLCDFWFKLKKDAIAHHKKPLLIAKQNLYPTMVIMTAEGARILANPLPPIAELPKWGAEVYLLDELVNRKYGDTTYR